MPNFYLNEICFDADYVFYTWVCFTIEFRALDRVRFHVNARTSHQSGNFAFGDAEDMTRKCRKDRKYKTKQTKEVSLVINSVVWKREGVSMPASKFTKKKIGI